MKISQKHKDFIRLVAEGSEQDKAYKLTVGNNKVTSATARVKGSQLAKKYADLIQLEKEKLSKVVEEARNSKVAEIEEKSLMSKIERIELLNKMAKGELEVETVFIVGGKPIKLKTKPTQTDVRAAIAEINKMCGDYAPQKTDITSDGGKISVPIINISKDE